MSFLEFDKIKSDSELTKQIYKFCFFTSSSVSHNDKASPGPTRVEQNYQDRFYKAPARKDDVILDDL